MHVSCRNNPVELSLTHDLSQPFFFAQGATATPHSVGSTFNLSSVAGVRISFSSPHIAISAVALRSFQFFVPQPIAFGDERRLYNIKSGLLLTTELAMFR